MRNLALEFLVVEAATVIDQIEMAVRRCGSLTPPSGDRTPILVHRVRQMRSKIEDAVAQNAALEEAFQERTGNPIEEHQVFCDADFKRAVEILRQRKNGGPA